MVLLTSSQVSVMITSGIVILFTLALFLSGYAIQQRTLRDLRIAIRPDPRPSPKIYLPDRFRQSTTEGDDGQTVVIDDHLATNRESEGQRKQNDLVIEVRPTVPEEVMQKPITKKADSKREKNEAKKTGQQEPEKPISRAERRRRIKQDIRELSQGEVPVHYQRRLW